VIKFIGFQQGAEESIRLRCSNDPRPGGRAAPKERRRGGVCAIISSMTSSRPPTAHPHDLACGSLASNLCASSPMEAQARLSPPKLSTNKVLQNKRVHPPKISSQRYHDKCKPRLMSKAPKHVHQNYLIKLNKCLKPYTIDQV
jgi:hypothetical protein